MTRFVPALVAVVALAPLACSTPDAPKTAGPAATASPAPPLTIHILVPEGAGPEAAAWAKELETAVGERGDGLSLAPTAETADLVVRVKEVARGETGRGPEPPGEGETFVMRGALVVGDATRDFDLTYRGEARPQAEALARSLRRFREEMKAGPSPPPAPAVR